MATQAQQNIAYSVAQMLGGSTSADPSVKAVTTQGYTPEPAPDASAPAATAPTYTAPAYVDPYANTVFGSTAKFNQVQGDWNAQRDNTFSSITDRQNNDANTYHGGLLDYIESMKTGQGKIDQQGVQNELARQQGQSGVLGSVGRGLRSGSTVLANKNAANSSAGDRLAAAYADIGQRELSGVDNQYEQGKYSIGLSQDDLNSQARLGSRHLEENKNNIVNSIVSDAQSAIAALNASAATASLPDRVDIEAKKTEIRNSAMAKLQAFDGELAAGKTAPASVDANRATANTLSNAGTAASSPFNYSTDIPLQFQNTGPFASELPLFSLPSNKTKTQTA